MTRSKGKTLFELLFVLAIMAILLAVALPNFKTVIADKKAEHMLRRIAQAVNVARTHAIKSGSIVTLCPTEEGLQCARDGRVWRNGSLIFSDSNADREINGDDKILLVVQHEASDGSIRWRSFQNKQYLQINGLGFTRNQNGSFSFCSKDSDPQKARQLVVNRLERTRFASDTNGDGIRENSQGKALSCS